MTYRSSYELELDVGFALLEQMEDQSGARRYDTAGNEDQFEDLLINGVYGGEIDPDKSQEFYVYTIDWPEELADEYDEEILETLSSELDSLFPGWVFNREEDEVYILDDPETGPAW